MVSAVSPIARNHISIAVPSIRQVIVYKGHERNPLFGPYLESVQKRVSMLTHLNSFRIANGQNPWTVHSVAGEHLIERLRPIAPEETLLVIPAGESSKLEAVFSEEQTRFMSDFFHRGGRGYFTCGAAYWASARRIYSDVCEEQPEKRSTIEKISKLPLFGGIAQGPLCPYPGKKYKVGFYSDAVEVNGNNQSCTVFLGGGGSFILPKETTQKISVLARYALPELQRKGKSNQHENAAILAQVGKGAALLSMFHPYYGSNDIDVEGYERAFPNSGTDWTEVRRKLSPLAVRMQFAFTMLRKLETLNFKA